MPGRHGSASGNGILRDVSRARAEYEPDSQDEEDSDPTATVTSTLTTDQVRGTWPCLVSTAFPNKYVDTAYRTATGIARFEIISK